uniref:2-C-methyl-D-erythritol 4-phosphate cytidylyltransferase, chloroplastic n=1 Tax=Strigamia maritima TaxID=126957 RepID=T1ISS1_STRMM
MDISEAFKNLKISVVLPAGGTGERIGIKPSKQFYQIEGKPLLCYSIESFERLSWINHIAVAVASDLIDQTKVICQQYKKVRVVVGGDTRHQSIAAGIKNLKLDLSLCLTDPDVAIIHDAVRPLVPLDVLVRVVIAARDYKAAGPICPLTSTVISKNENEVLDTCLDRSKYFASEMPQAFDYNVILEAYDKCSKYDFEFGTECLHLVDKYCDVKAKLVNGSPDLWKVTYKKDLYAAEALLKMEANCYLHFGTVCKNLSDKITSKLKSKISLCNEVLESPNCIIFHLNCFLSSENLNCCIPEIYSTSPHTPKRMINVLCVEKLGVESLTFEAIENYAKKFESTDKICFTVWKRSKDWSDKIITRMTDLFTDLLQLPYQNLCGQLFKDIAYVSQSNTV